MKVIELLFSVDREQLLNRWNELYKNDFEADPDDHDSRRFEQHRAGLRYIDRVLQALKDAVPERCKLKVIVETKGAEYEQRGLKWDAEFYGRREIDKNHVEVNGIGPPSAEDEPFTNEGENTRWAIDFTPWGQWREAEVVQNPLDAKMSDLDLATHIIEELTWHGLPSAQEERHDELMDRVGEVDRAIETGDWKNFHRVLPPPYGCLFIDIGVECGHEPKCDPSKFLSGEEYDALMERNKE
jgi:predicted nucleotidyltransferase